MANSDSISWIDETREAVDRASNVVQAQSELEVLATAEEDLDNAIRDLSDVQTAAVVGQGIWWTGSDAPAELWTELRSAHKDLGQRQLAFVMRKLAEFRRRVRDAVQTGWATHVASRAGDAGDLRDLIQVLSGVEGLAEIARSLDQALGRLARLQTKLPDSQAVQTLDEAVDLLDALERRLPAAVKVFVSTAARGGASIDLLGADVRGWLVDNGALNNFRIVPGRPQEVSGG
ncbi:hypothetical protein HC031_14135 [Planosporangium thailandense]|uniref:WXG100 family type VII secretion target n=1 Tax=Planosporangium thailandense TaxID=765197 RepID=A0ABX0XXR8_9ACTN|nr:hypothetical protein [Planosporangium thailandense]NJC70847.1 hypothetical protein [Planosporangium thailandense]